MLGYRSRFLPQVSPRVITLTQLDSLALGVLGGVSVLGMLHGLHRTSAKYVRGTTKLGQARTGQNHQRGTCLYTHNRRRCFLQRATC